MIRRAADAVLEGREDESEIILEEIRVINSSFHSKGSTYPTYRYV